MISNNIAFLTNVGSDEPYLETPNDVQSVV